MKRRCFLCLISAKRQNYGADPESVGRISHCPPEEGSKVSLGRKGLVTKQQQQLENVGGTFVLIGPGWMMLNLWP